MSDGRNAFSARRSRRDGILAAGEEQGGALEFRRDFTHDVNRFRFQVLQMVQMITVQGVRS